MTNQEAINILGQYDVSNIHFYTTDGEEIPFTEWSDAIEMAISALQAQDLQPTCNNLATDTISRTAAIDVLKGLPTWWADEGGYYGGAQPPMVALLDPEDAVSAIENLPSAEPEQKWIPCKTGILPEEKDEFYQATYLLDDGDRMVDYVYFNSKGMWSNYAYETSELLAWMPLPEAYKGDK